VHDDVDSIETAFELLFVRDIRDDQLEALGQCRVAGAQVVIDDDFVPEPT
jgi:hypothetical protein